MEKKEQIRIAKIVIAKGISRDELYYSDYMYGNESETDKVWEYVEECKNIGLIAFKLKYLD